MKALITVLLISFSISGFSQDVIDIEMEFGKVDTLNLDPETLHDYFISITSTYKYYDANDAYNELFSKVENHPTLLKNEMFKAHYYLFKARVYRLSMDFNATFYNLNIIPTNLKWFTKQDSLNYYVMFHIATRKQGLYQQSIEYAEKINSIDNLKSTRAPNYAPDIYWLVGSDFSYSAMGDYKGAIKESKRSLKNAQENYPEDYFFLFNRANNVGVFYNNDREADSAIIYFNKALGYLDFYNADFKASKEAYTALIRGNIAQSYMIKEDYEAAIPLLKEDIAMSEVNFVDNTIVSTLLLAECYTKLKQLNKANETVEKVRAFGQEAINGLNIKYKLKWFEIRSEIAELNGNLARALNINKQLLNFKDSIDREQMVSRALALQTAFDYDNKEEELNAAKQREASLKQQLDRRRNVLLGTGLIGLFLLSIILFYRRNIIKQKRISQKLKRLNTLVEDNKLTIEHTLNEKETLLKEIHHRVKNNLQVVSSLLSLQGNSMANKEAKEALLDGQSRVRSMALVHQRLYETDNFKDVNFKDYTVQLVQNLIASYDGNGDVLYEINSNEVLDIDVAMPLGLITNEIITNSLKYCNSITDCKINITFKRAKNDYILKASDNGSGFDLETAKSKGTLGIKLIEILVKQLEGELNISTAHDAPTTYTITFPANT